MCGSENPLPVAFWTVRNAIRFRSVSWRLLDRLCIVELCHRDGEPALSIFAWLTEFRATTSGGYIFRSAISCSWDDGSDQPCRKFTNDTLPHRRQT